MKKVAILSILLVLPLISFSQKMKEGDIELGIGGGYSSATVSTSKGIVKTGRNSNNLFASVEYYFSNRWGVKAKIIKDNKGWNEGYINFTDQYGNTSSYTTNYELNYVTVPVMANWHFGSNRKWNLNFGFYMGFLTSAKETKLNTNLIDGFNSSDFGLSYGIGYKFPVTDQLKIAIEYDEQYGFNNIFKQSNISTINNRGSYNIGLIYSLK